MKGYVISGFIAILLSTQLTKADDIPEMIDIPKGSYFEGCKNGRDDHNGFKCKQNGKQANVDSFRIGKYEVTFNDWDACVKDEKCPQAEDNDWGRENHPVINVGWNDAQDYITWLNEKTGRKFRLPSSKEWEYAARGNSNSMYPWGDDITCDNAKFSFNEKPCGSEGTAPVGSFKPNGYGIYDTSGNVSEWCQDVYQGQKIKYDNPQETVDTMVRVIRGGSWNDEPRHVRIISNGFGTWYNKMNNLGFRLAESVNH